MPFYETATLRVPELLFVPQIWIKSWTTMRCALACRNRKRGRKITWRSCRNRFAGTTYSCVSLSLVNKLCLRKFIIRPNDSQKIFSADGKPLKVLVVFEMSIDINELRIPLSLYVIRNLHHDMLLGLHLLAHTQAQIDLSNNVVILQWTD